MTPSMYFEHLSKIHKLQTSYLLGSKEQNNIQKYLPLISTRPVVKHHNDKVSIDYFPTASSKLVHKKNVSKIFLLKITKRFFIFCLLSYYFEHFFSFVEDGESFFLVPIIEFECCDIVQFNNFLKIFICTKIIEIIKMLDIERKQRHLSTIFC